LGRVDLGLLALNLLRYLLPAVSVALAVGLAQMVGVFVGPEAAPFEREETLLLLLFAVMVSAWFGGLGPGLLAVLLSLLASDYLLLQPLRSLLDFNPGQGPLLGTFLVEGVAICAFIAILRGLQSRQRETEQEYRTVVETASDAVITINEAGEIRFANRAAEKIFGRSRSEMIGQSLTLLISGRQRPQHEVAFRRYLETGERTVNWESLSVTGLHASGREIPLEVSYAEHFRDGYRYFTGFIRDVSDRRRAEAEIRRSEQRFRSVVEQASDAFFVHDLDGWFVDVNRRACESLGYTREELLEMSVPEVEVAYTPGALERLWDRISTGEVLTVEGTHRRKDGSEFPVEVRVGRFEAEGRRLVLALARDVSERQRAEARFQSLVQNSSDVVAVIGVEGEILYHSPSVERVLGYRPEETVGKSGFELLHPDDMEEARRSLTETLEAGEPGTVELRVRHADGSWRYMEATVTDMTHDPAVGGMVANYRDVTDRRRAIEDLKASEQRYRTVVEQAAESIFLVDAGTQRILQANTAFCRLIGYSQEEIQGLELYDIVAHDPQSVDRNIRRVRESGSYFIGERQYRHKDGSLLDVEVSVSEISYAGREVFCVVAHDVTDRKRMESLLQEIQEHERSRIARELHDTVLQDLVYALQEMQAMRALPGGGPRDGGGLSPAITALRRSVQGLREALYELRLDEGDPEFAESLAAVVEQNRQMAPELRITLEVEPGLPALPVVVSRELLRIVQEALTNARTHSGAGYVSVSVTADGGELRLEVSDDGRGFSPVETVGGLGLRGMRERAFVIGGELEVSTGLGIGTRVSFHSPIPG
jgi:PAS domain S-box-containing protein